MGLIMTPFALYLVALALTVMWASHYACMGENADNCQCCENSCCHAKHWGSCVGGPGYACGENGEKCTKNGRICTTVYCGCCTAFFARICCGSSIGPGRPWPGGQAGDG